MTRAGSKRVGRGGERTDDVDRDHSAGDIGNLPASQEPNGHRSTSGKGIQHRRKTFGLANDEVTDADVRAQAFQLVDDLLDRADQEKGCLVDQPTGYAEPFGHDIQLIPGTDANVCGLHQRRALDVVETIPRFLGQPSRPFADGREGKTAGCRPATFAVRQTGELEDVGVARGDPDDALAVSADQQRNVILCGTNSQVVNVETVVQSVEVRCTGIEQRAQRDHRFLESRDAGCRLAKEQTDRVVFRLGVSGSETQHEPATDELVDGGGGPSKQRRMVKLVVEHQRTDAQPDRGFGSNHQRYEGIDRADVIESEQLVIPQRLDLACLLDQGVAITEIAPLHRETKGPHDPDHRSTIRRPAARTGRSTSSAGTATVRQTRHRSSRVVRGQTMKDMRGMTAVVTGASRGIGVHIARALAEQGVNLSLAARSKPELEVVRTEMAALGVKAIATKCDVTNADDRARLIGRSEAELGTIDLLINNAGIETVSHFETADEDEIMRTIDVNLVAAIALTRALLPGMLERKRGHVVNIASGAGKVGMPYAVAYATSKHGLVGFTNSLRCEYHKQPVGFSVVCPGFVTDTGMYWRWEEAGVKAPKIVGRSSPQKV